MSLGDLWVWITQDRGGAGEQLGLGTLLPNASIRTVLTVVKKLLRVIPDGPEFGK